MSWDVIKIQIIFGFLDGFARILLDKNFHISLVHQTWSLGKQVPDVPTGPPEPRRGFLVRHSRCLTTYKTTLHDLGRSPSQDTNKKIFSIL